MTTDDIRKLDIQPGTCLVIKANVTTEQLHHMRCVLNECFPYTVPIIVKNEDESISTMSREQLEKMRDDISAMLAEPDPIIPGINGP